MIQPAFNHNVSYRIQNPNLTDTEPHQASQFHTQARLMVGNDSRKEDRRVSSKLLMLKYEKDNAFQFISKEKCQKGLT